MDLNTQIISIIFSIIYGAAFGTLYNFCYYFLYNNLLRYKLLINFLFVTNIVLIYFIIMFKINCGNINLAFIFFLLLNFLLSIRFTKKLRKIVKCLKSKGLNHLNII